MAITLTEESLPERVNKQGSDSFTLAAGKYLKVETTPDGEELLNEQLSEADAYQVTVSIYARKS